KGVWEIYSRGLKALLEKHGFMGDVGCTTDFVRILRVPNSVNCKHVPPTPVTLLATGQEYDFATALPFAAAGAALSMLTSPTASRGLPSIPARFTGRKDTIVVADDQ